MFVARDANSLRVAEASLATWKTAWYAWLTAERKRPGPAMWASASATSRNTYGRTIRPRQPRTPARQATRMRTHPCTDERHVRLVRRGGRGRADDGHQLERHAVLVDVIRPLDGRTRWERAQRKRCRGLEHLGVHGHALARHPSCLSGWRLARGPSILGGPGQRAQPRDASLHEFVLTSLHAGTHPAAVRRPPDRGSAPRSRPP